MSDPHHHPPSPGPAGLALGRTSPLAPPLYQSSVYTVPDLDELDRVIAGSSPGYIYARDGHPNAGHLAGQLAALEGGSWAVVCGSGMAALSGCLLALVQQGDRVLGSNRLYGRTTQLLHQELPRFGVTASAVDTSDLDQVKAALKATTGKAAKPPAVLVVETVSNPLLRVADLDALAEMTEAAGTILLVDNTFATPALVKPLACGADLVVESLTKLIGGHSDVTLGAVAGAGVIPERLAAAIRIWGLAPPPFDCWLASRGLATLSIRLRAAAETAAMLADWLAAQPGVLRVVYPGRPDHPDHELAKRQLGGFGNMLCFELDGGRVAVNRFMRATPDVPFSPSLGDTMTTCSHPASTSHRYVPAAEKASQGITDGLVRLSVGIEEPDRIRAAIGRGFGGRD